MPSHVIVDIFDSFIDYDRRELFYCKLKDRTKCWFVKANVPKAVLTKFIKRKFKDDEFRRKEQTKLDYQAQEALCQVDKTDEFACDLKTKTRGLLIGCSNCGIIICYKEMYAKESLTQVARLILATKHNFKGPTKIFFLQNSYKI